MMSQLVQAIGLKDLTQDEGTDLKFLIQENERLIVRVAWDRNPNLVTRIFVDSDEEFSAWKTTIQRHGASATAATKDSTAVTQATKDAEAITQVKPTTPQSEGTQDIELPEITREEMLRQVALYNEAHKKKATPQLTAPVSAPGPSLKKGKKPNFEKMQDPADEKESAPNPNPQPFEKPAISTTQEQEYADYLMNLLDDPASEAASQQEVAADSGSSGRS